MNNKELRKKKKNIILKFPKKALCDGHFGLNM